MDHREKLEWASRQLDSFDEEFDNFVALHPFATRTDIQHEARRIRLLACPSAPMPSHWPFLIGDIIHNTRCALDYLTWELSLRAPVPPNPSEMRDIQFPICTSHGEYWGSGPNGKGGKRVRRLRFLDPRAQAIIDGLQPHLRGEAAEDHPLAVLNELANEDKHRKVLLTILIADVNHVSFLHFGGPILPTTRVSTPTRRYETDAELKVFDFHQAIPEKDVEVTGHPTGNVAFDGTGAASGLGVLGFLRGAHDRIRIQVFEPLEPFLA